MNFNQFIWKLLILLVGITPLFETMTLRSTRPEFVTDQIEGMARLILFGCFLSFSLIGAILLPKKLFSKDHTKGNILIFGLLSLYFGPFISQKLGLVPSNSIQLVLVILFFITVYILPPIDLNDFIKQTKKVLLFYIYGSLLSIIIFPNWAVDFNYQQGLFAGFNIRLHGLASHPNSLAPLLAMYLALNFYSPSNRMIGKIHILATLVCLLLTQSKTIWIMVIGIYLIYFLYRIIKLNGRLKFLVLFFVNLLTALLVFSLAVSSSYLMDYIISNRLYEFTGRSVIWDITVESWRWNPLFGFGITLWGEQMKLEYLPTLGWTPGHAHSQFYQTLGESGIIGIIGLFTYLIIILIYTLKFFKASKGLSLMFFFFLLVRGVTEPVFTNTFTNISFIVHVIIFCFLLLYIKQKESIITV